MTIVIDSATHVAFREFRLIMFGAHSFKDDLLNELSRAARPLVEFDRIEIYYVGDDMGNYRHGMRFYTGDLCPLHIKHALCGYGGSGPALSDKILDLVGVNVPQRDYHMRRSGHIRFTRVATGWTYQVLLPASADEIKNAQTLLHTS